MDAISHDGLSRDEFVVLRALGEVAMPPGEHISLLSEDRAGLIRRVIDLTGADSVRYYKTALQTLDLAAVPMAGERFSKLSTDVRARVLKRMEDNPATQVLLRVLTIPIKYALLHDPRMYEALGARFGVAPAQALERSRWEERVVDASTLSADEDIEVDAVVVGTGAGGAPVARALASAGHAVLMLEEGAFFRRDEFNGQVLEMQRKLYRRGGMNYTRGNVPIMLPIGMTVGGTTTINSGTCFRTPERVLHRWRMEHGLSDLTMAAMEPFFARVEERIGVSLPDAATLGGCARVIARGSEALGYRHGPLHRNAQGCDGQGVCCFGCPTDAKQSTNVSYVPEALRAGSMLYTRAKVERVLRSGGHATGVIARAVRSDGRSIQLRVRARTVVLACGTLHTPLVLSRSGLADRSGQLGRNLTIHPASHAWGLFDEPIDGDKAIPQGYGVDEFEALGLRIEGAFTPLDVTASLMNRLGRGWTNTVERFRNLACFGFMIADTSRGRVVEGTDGQPDAVYFLNDHDKRKILLGHSILARIYFAAGAREVYVPVQGVPDLLNLDDVERFERDAPSSVSAPQIDISAYHPLGTCRMGADPSRSVVDGNQEFHGLKGLFVSDGSVVSGPLGVNPQITIMALAERAGEFASRRLENSTERVVSAPSQQPNTDPGRSARANRTDAEFRETMAGQLTWETSDRQGMVSPASFTVRVFARDLREKLKDFATSESLWNLEGTVTIAGVASETPCFGTLAMHPYRNRGTLVYRLEWTTPEGHTWLLNGEKHVSALRMMATMTTLHTELVRMEDGVRVATGILKFATRDLIPWLASFRMLSSPSSRY